MINLYFVKASKIYFDGKLQDLDTLYKKCIAASLSSVLLIIFCFMLFGSTLVNYFLRIDEIENAYFAINVMFLSTIGQSIAVFSLTLFRNIGRFKFVTALDSLNLILAFLFLSFLLVFLFLNLILLCLFLFNLLFTIHVFVIVVHCGTFRLQGGGEINPDW